jgi:DNA replication protein
MNYYEEYSKGHLVLPAALLSQFSKIFPSAEDFLIWLYFFENKDVAPSEIARAIGKKLADVNHSIDRLTKFGAMKVTLIEIAGEMGTFFDISPAFSKLDEVMNSVAPMNTAEVTKQPQNMGQLKELIGIFEAEMGMISPVQREELQAWLFEDGYDLTLIRQALREAVLNRKVSLKYIAGILRNWKNAGINSVQAVEMKQTERNEAKKTAPQKDFYIPMDGPWNN